MTISTSPHGAITTIGTTVYGADEDPIGASQVYDVVANNLLHASAMAGQVRVAAMHPTLTGSKIGTTDASPTAGQYYLVSGGLCGRWPLTLNADGTPYQLRVRLRGATSNASGAITYRLVLCPPGEWRSHYQLARDFVWTSNATSSTSQAWLTGSTEGSGNYANRLVVTAQQAAAWTRQHAIVDAVSTGDPRAIRQCLVALHVLASTSNNAGVARLMSVYAAEWIGV